MLTREHQSTLLQIARESIAGRFDGRGAAVDPAAFDAELRRPAGAFVTLKSEEGRLRGCIGSVVPVDPLCRAVAQSAVNAAFRDPRFWPLTRDELPGIRMEISVMGPLVPVASVDEIVCGRDGLMVRRGACAGLLLPQVAAERNWDPETFLSQTCVKAGLPPQAWHDSDIRIERFAAHVFRE